MKIKTMLENLKEKTVRELNQLARRYELAGYSRLKKTDLISMLKKHLGQMTKKAQEVKKSAAKKPNKFAPERNAPQKKTAAKSISRPATKAPVELPASYGDGRMVLLPRDPHWLYVYWDLTQEQAFVIRSGGIPTLRLVGLPECREIERITLTPDAKNWYLQVISAASDYLMEIGFVDRKGSFRPVLTSNPASTPPDNVSKNFMASFGSFRPGEKALPVDAPLKPRRELAEQLHGLSVGPGGKIDSAAALQDLQGQPGSSFLK